MIALGVSSQNKQLRAYTIEDGLPQSQVYTMAQDLKGYLWIGTQGGGIARFDGKDFEVFNETNGLASNYIHALKAANDTLFIGTKKGLTLKFKNKFSNIKGPQVNEVLKFGSVIYLLTNKGLYTLLNVNTIKKVEVHEDFDTSEIRAIVFDGDYYWIGTNNGLWKLEALTSDSKVTEHLDFNNYTSLTAFESKIFASTFNSGTLVIEDQNFEDADLIRNPLRINKTSIQNSNQLWIATDNKGVCVIDTKTHKELFSINSRNGLSTSHVRQVLSDQYLNLWIATSGGGLYKYFQNSFKYYNTDTGLNANRVYAVHHHNHKLWLSTSESGLMQIDKMGIHNVAVPEAFANVKIKAIITDDDGNIWAGSEGNGLLFKGKITRDSIVEDTLKTFKKKVPRTIEVTKVLNSENGFPFNWIRSIHIKNDTVWAATYGDGIVKFNYDPNKDKLTIYKTYSNLEGLKDMAIRYLTKDKNNRLWYATQNGHLGYLHGNQIVHKGLVLDQNTSINTILFNDNTMFLGTSGQGIWWSDDSNFNVFKKLKGLKNISSENSYQLIFDNQGYLWSGSEKGVDKIELSKDNVVNDVFFFGRNEGFLGIETCLNAVSKDDNGHLWFGAINGLVEYQPSEGSNNQSIPNVFLEDVKVAYKSIDTINFSSWNNFEETLELNTNQRQISFSFKTIDLDHPNGIEYRYKLNDDEWSPWSNNSNQGFSELNFGRYKFKVQSRNYRWIESKPIQFLFNIETPLHKKAWFQWLIIGVVTAIVIGVVMLYVKRLKLKNHQEQERLQLENHLLSLEQKALRLQMNPHFIFNVLNGIKAMAITKPEKMNDTVNNFAALLRETLVNSRKETISLSQEMKTLKHYIEVEQLMTEASFDYEIHVKTTIDTEEILVPPMLIQPFVENAIRHGILKGNRRGMLNITFHNSDSKLHVVIKDNGIGIFKSQQQKKNTDHQSMALTVTKERLESISGENALHISEIKNNDGTIIGTEIAFSIPLETDY